jgi:hypothetical protein
MLQDWMKAVIPPLKIVVQGLGFMDADPGKLGEAMLETVTDVAELDAGP